MTKTYSYKTHFNDAVSASTPTNGLTLITMKTAVKDVVFLAGSFDGGDAYAPTQSVTLAHLTTLLITEGTLSHKKDELHTALERLGASVTFSCENFRIKFSASCMKKDLELVLSLIVEQLREPKFSASDYKLVTQRYLAELDQLSEDTNLRADIRLSQLLYSKDNHNYKYDLKTLKNHVKKTTLADIKKYHSTYFGVGSMIIAITGDIEEKNINALFYKHFKTLAFKEHTQVALNSKKTSVSNNTEFITIHDKANVDLYIGTKININYNHEDFLPLTLATTIFGGNFFSRLMQSVREEKGLTYRVRASLGGLAGAMDGYFFIFAQFAPELLKKGMTAIAEELNRFIENGVTAQELKRVKETVSGSYKVGFSSSRATAGILLQNFERDKDAEYIDNYLSIINKISLSEVNGAIKKYLKKDQFITVGAGAVDKHGDVLKT